MVNINLSYTKQVREYCLNNQGTVLDVSLMKDNEFSEIPYKTLLKILNRLEEEKSISGISKGVYAIGKLNVQSEPDIMREYTENGKGMIVGGILYQHRRSERSESKRLSDRSVQQPRQINPATEI